MFTLTTALLLCLLGFAVGAFGTLVGAGGGFLLTPVLLLIYPHDQPETITAISLVVVFFNASSGSIAYARQRRIDYRSGIVFAAATLPGAVLGVLVVGQVRRYAFDAVMGIVLAALAVWLLRGGAREEEGHGVPRAGGKTVAREIVDRRGERYRYAVPLRRGFLMSIGVGFISSFLGIGGGVIHVPLLVGLLGFPTHIATATSHFVLAWMAAVATIAHALTGHFDRAVDLERAAALSVGVIGGAQLGAWLSQRMSGRAIQRLLAFGLLVLAVRLIASYV